MHFETRSGKFCKESFKALSLYLFTFSVFGTFFFFLTPSQKWFLERSHRKIYECCHSGEAFVLCVFLYPLSWLFILLLLTFFFHPCPQTKDTQAHSHCMQYTQAQYTQTLWIIADKKLSFYVKQKHSFVVFSFQVWQTWQGGQITAHTPRQKSELSFLFHLCGNLYFFIFSIILFLREENLSTYTASNAQSVLFQASILTNRRAAQQYKKWFDIYRFYYTTKSLS